MTTPTSTSTSGPSAAGRARAAPSARRGNTGRAPRREGRRYVPRRKVCLFCAEKNLVLDYKNVDVLRRYVSDRGRIEPRRRTGTCARHQRTLARHLKLARYVGLLPFTTDTLHEAPPAR